MAPSHSQAGSQHPRLLGHPAGSDPEPFGLSFPPGLHRERSPERPFLLVAAQNQTVTAPAPPFRPIPGHATPRAAIPESSARIRRSRTRFERRLRELAREAEAEGYPFSRDSETVFRRFLDEYPALEPGRLFLMNDGNLRATWKEERGSHVGLQFLPDERVQYVIFTRRPSSRTVSRVHGDDTLSGIPRILAAYDLRHVLEP